jgi:hypothetical protein
MNERIKELAEKAFDKANDGSISDIKITKEFVEKFAELLIQQCINVCEPVLDEPYEDMSEFGKGLVEGQDVAVEKIKRHFGVEE